MTNQTETTTAIHDSRLSALEHFAHLSIEQNLEDGARREALSEDVGLEGGATMDWFCGRWVSADPNLLTVSFEDGREYELRVSVRRVR